MPAVVKTSFDEEQKRKDAAFLALDPLDRWKVRLQTRKLMRKKNVNYSYEGIYYGVNRNTGDLDILIEPSKVNGSKLLKALSFLKLEVPDIQLESELVLSFGLEPDAVDIISYTPGVDFVQVWANSKLINFDGLKVRIIDIRDLLKNKEALQRKG